MALLNDIADVLERHDTTFSKLLVSVLQDVHGTTQESLFREDLLLSTNEILGAFCQHSAARIWTTRFQEQIFTRELQLLTQKQTGWHFSAVHASADQVEDFHLEEMATSMEGLAPGLWHLLDALVHSHDSRKRVRDEAKNTVDEEEDMYWKAVDPLEDENLIGRSQDGGRKRAARGVVERRRKNIQRIRKVIVLSILMLTVNQKCNAFASIIGIFCHAHNVPEKVVEVLSRLGVSISIDAIDDAINALSIQANETIRRLGQTLTVAYAYDNFDMDFKISVPTIEKGSESTLQHLTSALLFPLSEATKAEDLKCSKDLWQRSRLNDELPDDRPGLAPLPDWKNLLKIHPQHQGLDADGLSTHDRFAVWKFLSDLFESGPEYFRQFRETLPRPEVIDLTPLQKTPIIPARAMHISNSTVSGNLDAIANLLSQGGVGDPAEVDDETLESMIDYVILMHGDLGTRREYHAGSDTACIRRFTIPSVPIRCLRNGPIPSENGTSPMAHASVLRPRETGKILTNPGFRRLHQIIMHDGTCRRLDCWKTAMKARNSQYTTLEEFAKSKPTFDQLCELAKGLVRMYVGTPTRIEDLRRHAAFSRDEQYENSLLTNYYYLLYEELSYAINEGDIGRVELCFAPWVFIFKACGKHRYAAKMTKHITDVHFFFSEGLKHAVRHSMLVNPSGIPGKFRPVDWVVESHNLYTKEVNVGPGPNRTVENVIKESVLLEVNRQTYSTLEKNLVLNHLTTHHSEPNMTETFAALARHMEQENAQPHAFVPGRKTHHKLENMVDKGLAMLLRGAANNNVEDEQEVELDPIDISPDVEDISLEFDL
ncbi:hypothetical protein NM688_g3331 [Phlebia brevispora]|uniref:Uncharacterized protein n=1 Tax=Phlebia brevispora TaxID=194682 RepID=A0ACC1T664_9APHY|nr:hypothetical protein NM688_g3331 [Phlebia brevispora]